MDERHAGSRADNRRSGRDAHDAGIGRRCIGAQVLQFILPPPRIQIGVFPKNVEAERRQPSGDSRRYEDDRREPAAEAQRYEPDRRQSSADTRRDEEDRRESPADARRYEAGSVLFAVGMVLFWLAVSWVLYRRGWAWRV